MKLDNQILKQCQEADFGSSWLITLKTKKENIQLRLLLKECKNIVAHDLWSRAQFPDGQIVEKDDILPRINAAIGESEE